MSGHPTVTEWSLRTYTARYSSRCARCLLDVRGCGVAELDETRREQLRRDRYISDTRHKHIHIECLPEVATEAQQRSLVAAVKRLAACGDVLSTQDQASLTGWARAGAPRIYGTEVARRLLRYKEFLEANLNHCNVVEIQKASVSWVEQARRRGALADAAEIEDEDLDARLDQLMPPGLSLYPYQKAGVAFVEASRGRALIADDMGLGKSAQSIMYLALHPEVLPALVVVPAIVAVNWEREFAMWAPQYKVQRLKSAADAVRPETQIVIASYGLWARYDAEQERLEKVLLRDSKKLVAFDDLIRLGADPLPGNKPFVEQRASTIKTWMTAEKKLTRVEERPPFVPRAIIADECFPAETMVLTENGPLPIGEIVASCLDVKVLSYNKDSEKTEYKPIRRWIKKRTLQPLLRVTHEKGTITCTPNHKIWTEQFGYVKAEALLGGEKLRVVPKAIQDKEEREVYGKILQPVLRGEKQWITARGEEKDRGCTTGSPCASEMRVVRRDLPCNSAAKKEEVLQHIVFRQVENERSQKKGSTRRENAGVLQERRPPAQREEEPCRCGTHETYESRPRVSEEGGGGNTKAVERKSDVSQARRKTSDHETPEAVIRASRGGRVRVGARDQNSSGTRTARTERGPSTTIPPQLLQRRHCACSVEDCNRSLREHAPLAEMEMDRCAEESRAEFSRVVCAKILEQGSSGEPRSRSSEDPFVYDLEVEGNHNYYADGVLVSNCHALKNTKTARTKAFLKTCKDAKPSALICLSGTPIINRPLEFHTTLKLLRPEEWSDWFAYTRQFCGGHWEEIYIPGGKGAKKRVWVCSGASNLEELNLRLRDVMIRRLKKDVLKELPDKIIVNTSVDLEPKELKAYNRIVDAAYAGVDKDLPGSHLVAITEARQAAGLAKVRAAVEWVKQYQEQDRPVLVFAHHKEVRDAIQEGIEDAKIRVDAIDGSVSQDKRQEIVEAFQAGKLDALVISIKAGGVGITLTRSSDVLLVERAWTPPDEWQAFDRTHRIGQENVVTVRILQAPVEIDEDMDELLTDKARIFRAAMEGEKLSRAEAESMQSDIKDELVARWQARR